jgi:hypothetical protein
MLHWDCSRVTREKTLDPEQHAKKVVAVLTCDHVAEIGHGNNKGRVDVIGFHMEEHGPSHSVTCCLPQPIVKANTMRLTTASRNTYGHGSVWVTLHPFLPNSRRSFDPDTLYSTL